jgi:hypothetical protein
MPLTPSTTKRGNLDFLHRPGGYAAFNLAATLPGRTPSRALFSADSPLATFAPQAKITKSGGTFLAKASVIPPL